MLSNFWKISNNLNKLNKNYAQHSIIKNKYIGITSLILKRKLSSNGSINTLDTEAKFFIWHNNLIYILLMILIESENKHKKNNNKKIKDRCNKINKRRYKKIKNKKNKYKK